MYIVHCLRMRPPQNILPEIMRYEQRIISKQQYFQKDYREAPL